MSEGSKLGLVEAKLGIIPGAGGTQRIARLVGAARAKELIFTARRLSANDARELGLVEYAVDAGGAFAKAMELAQEIQTQAPLSLRLAKVAVNRGSEVDLATGMAIEQACYAQVGDIPLILG
ncbi:hypothetical protein CYMTET_22622 [Cymbomonas tetramitiformis]|uniref:Enoyl-CoA hydratase n=1 Tax=Cymbomonas tetramitiformis TaxID=36881 RepID=A0AAE0FZL8_9CHLO|nr:hypothetical protein CYMTET_22622 [Cymbomonas tetramitiformis]